MQFRLLVVDQDVQYREWLRHHLGALCPDAIINVVDLSQLERSLKALAPIECDLLMLGASFGTSPEDPQARGLEALRLLRSHPGISAVIPVAEDGNELTAVRALQLGAVDYLPKKLLTSERLRTSVRVALNRIQRARERNSAGRSRQTAAEASAASPSLAALRGLIPGYTIRSAIGESEKAVVYVAASQQLGREVALKVSKIEQDDSERLHPFEREFEAVQAVKHPAIVEIYDYGVQSGHEYLAMEYFPRGDLKSRLQKGLSEDTAVHYVEKIANALRVLHHAGVLHRDLKPPNVMLRENDDIALIDFGLSRHVQGTLRNTRTGVLRGSPYYMSPEQALGESLDARTDLYSLGIICYEMLTGRKPYTGESAMEVLQQHVNGPVPRLPETLTHYQPLLDKLLAKSREERFESAEATITAIISAREANELLRSNAA